MDKYEYKVRSDEIKELISEGDYRQAAEIADTIDWRRVKNVKMLCMISDLYKINRRYEDARDLMLMAYEYRPGGRNICYSLCELYIKTDDILQAIKYYKEFVLIAPKDSGRYILQYKIYEAQDVSLEERIGVLEEMKRHDYREKWVYELAYLYYRIGLSTRCVEECDELISMMGDGKYVIKAMELKMINNQPLTPAQQEKYDHRFDAVPEETAQSEQEAEEPVYQEEMTEGELAEEQEPAEEQVQSEEREQEVPTETMVYEPVRPEAQEQEELVQEAQPSSESGTVESEELDIHVKTVDVGEYNTINLQAEIAQGLQEVLGEGVEQPAEQSAVIESVLPIESEQVEHTEVFFGETGNISEASEEVPEEIPEEISEEIPGEVSGEPQNVPDITGEIVMKQMREEAITAGLQAVSEAQPPKEMADVLAQDSDGQISLVMPESQKVEKQITGQMKIEDVMAEWERMKQENAEKRKEEVRQHVKQQTGRMFSEFDAAVRDGLLEQLEKKAEEEPEQEEPELEEFQEIAQTEEPEEMAPTEPGEPEESTELEAIEESAESGEREEPAESEEVEMEENIGETAAETPAKEQGVRPMTKEERELYAPFVQSKAAREQIVKAIDSISLAAYTGNVIITGEEGMDTLSLAKNMVKEIQSTDSNFSGKIAKISGRALNKKDVSEIIKPLQNGALIIQKACDMEEKTVQDLYRILQQEDLGIVVLIEDTRKVMNSFLSDYGQLLDVFTVRVDVEALSNDTLVAFGRQYAHEMEYSIDELGVLALHTRIEEKQTVDHAVTAPEVKEMVDDAIQHANRKNMKHFFDILLFKRYDEDDMIVLTERDFA